MTITNTDLSNTLQSIQLYRTGLVEKLNQRGLKLAPGASLYQSLSAIDSIQNLQPQANLLLTDILNILGSKSHSDSTSESASESSSQAGSDSSSQSASASSSQSDSGSTSQSSSQSASQSSSFDLRGYGDVIYGSIPTPSRPNGDDLGSIQVMYYSAFSTDDDYQECMVTLWRYTFASSVSMNNYMVCTLGNSTQGFAQTNYFDWDGQSIPQMDPSSISVWEQQGSTNLYWWGSFAGNTSATTANEKAFCQAGYPVRVNMQLTGSSAGYRNWLVWKAPNIVWTDSGSLLTAVFDLSSLNGIVHSGDTQLVVHQGYKSYQAYDIHVNLKNTLKLQWSK